MKVIWSPLALERVGEITDYIAQDNVTAEKWVNEIFDRTLLLEEFPYQGRVVPEVERQDIREIFFKKYRVIYRVTNDEISILTVRHGKQILPVDELLINES